MGRINRLIATISATALVVGSLSGCNVALSESKKIEANYTYKASEYVNVADYKGVNVTLKDYTVTEEQLQNVIDQVVEKYVQYEIADKAIEDKDQVKLSFTASIGGEKVDGFSSNDYTLIIGENNFIVEGFEEKLIGLKAGDKRAITGLTIPEDFMEASYYAGKKVVFDVEIIGVYSPYLMEYNDEFVSAASDGEYTTVEKYNEFLMEQLKKNAETNKYKEKYDKVMEYVVNNSQVIKDLPEEYIEQKESELNRQAEFYSGLYDYTTEEYIQKAYGTETTREAAKNIVMLELVFQYIIEKENFSVTENYYSENVLKTANRHKYTSVEKFESDYGKDGIVKVMLMDMAEDFIMNNTVEN